ncbi:MAG: retroviral-like aspartic protease family protein [Rubrobacter sp.]|nr:retroviral-like aspartic protease family protein [Rubrobacter sp.]
MARSPVPGEAEFRRVFGGLLAVSGIYLTVHKETRADAILDTGSTFCVISQDIADRLGLTEDDRRGTQRNMIVGGRITLMNRYRLDSIQAGSARAYYVDLLVGDALPQFILLGMSFIAKFTTTLDLDEKRVVFRTRTSY